MRYSLMYFSALLKMTCLFALGFSWHIEAVVFPGDAIEANLIALLDAVLLNVLFSSLEDDLPFRSVFLFLLESSPGLLGLCRGLLLSLLQKGFWDLRQLFCFTVRHDGRMG